MIYFLLLVYIISKAPCTEIIERATSIVDYELIDEKRSPDTAASVTRVCPVLHDLYQADLSMSDSWSQSLSMLLRYPFILLYYDVGLLLYYDVGLLLYYDVGLTYISGATNHFL